MDARYGRLLARPEHRGLQSVGEYVPRALRPRDASNRAGAGSRDRWRGRSRRRRGHRHRVDGGDLRVHGDAPRHPASRGFPVRGAKGRTGARNRAFRHRVAHRGEARARDRTRGAARRAFGPGRRGRPGPRRDPLGRAEGRERGEAAGPRGRRPAHRRGHRSHGEADRRHPREPRRPGRPARVPRAARPALVTTLLVANRGEIARRIFRTAKRMGMRAVAVYSDADAGLPFVREADAAIRIGPAPAAESYLAIDRVIAAAREARADLIHPGYGFLAERPEFASAVDAAGMRFVGPPPSVLKSLGDKGEAKTIAERVKVPVVPGYRGDDQSDEAFLRAARSVHYPVMIKPVAGGGGIGMQTVREESQLRDALARARRVATAAFGDERILLERLVERPRHIEVQVLADEHGTVMTVGDRDCSAQRRHQKIVEEAPALRPDEKGRERMSAAAIAIAREAGYRNAGTVEFVVDDRGTFYFLEVNARLQVEHPVTELVYGVDLVEQQLRIAMGERLDLKPNQHGRQHAIE